jgi:pimeloyl-ACP methyl ester carboxylesterase
MTDHLPLLPVAPEFHTWRGYQVAGYRAGSGRPVLLIHSINAAASAFEMRGPFAGLQDRAAVHALDLLGYGNSDRPPRRYRADDYIDLIGDHLARINAPTTLIASSLGAAYAVAAAARWPERVNALVLACPTGLEQLAERPGIPAYVAYQILRSPFGKLLFRALTSRAGTRYFLRDQAYARKESITPETHDGFYYTCRRPGAYYAPICFLTGLLNCDVRAAFPRLHQPILLVWGKQATTTPVRRAEAFQQANPRARLAVIDNASLLVQDERPEEFCALVKEFLKEIP